MWGSGELIKHTNIYDHKYNDAYNYYYSVLFALILKPFYYLPFYWVKFWWLILNLALFVHLCYLLIKSKISEVLNQKQKQWFYAISFAFAFKFMHENIHYAQVTILLLWCCVYGLYSIYNQQSIKGTLLLAIGINIKLFPLVFLPYLIYRGFFKELVYVVVFYFAFMFLPSIIIGHEYNLQLIKGWWTLINPTNSNHVLDTDERSFHGLSTLLSTLFVKNVPDLYAMPLRRNLFDVSFPVFEKILLCSRLILMAITLKFLNWPPFKKNNNSFLTVLEISYILLAIPLIFPHQQHYAFLFASPAFAVAVYFYVVNQKSFSVNQRNIFMASLLFSFICCTIKLWLGEFNEYYEHFKILTYGALMLIPTLIWVSNLNKKFKIALN